jgi:hypothetical protein
MTSTKLKFRYDTNQNWYKGNTHIHSTRSDGGKTLSELGKIYSEAGYHFLFITDHWNASDIRMMDLPKDLLWLDGVELDGKDQTGADFHVVCLGKVEGIDGNRNLVQAIQSARQQGAMLVLAHPSWCANSFEDALRWKFDGVEIYNHVCHWLNGNGNGGSYWNMMLKQNPNTLGFAVDDAHIRPEHPGWNGGWIVVNSEKLDEDGILSAIRNGNYYSSRGPAFHSITLDGDQVVIQTSSVKFIRLVGPGWNGIQLGSFDGALLEEASIKIPLDWEYHYIEIEDDQGHLAWTNSLFV